MNKIFGLLGAGHIGIMLAPRARGLWFDPPTNLKYFFGNTNDTQEITASYSHFSVECHTELKKINKSNILDREKMNKNVCFILLRLTLNIEWCHFFLFFLSTECPRMNSRYKFSFDIFLFQFFCF